MIGLLAGIMATAPVAAASSSVFLNAVWADRAVEPTSFSPNKGPANLVGLHNYVNSIHWSSWGGPEATGTGNVDILRSDPHATSPVTVTLGGQSLCGGQSVYTTYSLQLAAGATTPNYWPGAATGSFPCHVNAGGYFPTDHPACVLDGHCEFESLSILNVPWLDEVPLRYFKWSPPLTQPVAYTIFLSMRWKSWGAVTTTGTGALTSGFKVWGVSVRLTGLAWCPMLGITYTKLGMVIYGKGEVLGTRSPKSLIERVRGQIGRRGFTPHAYSQTVPAREGCQAVA